MDEHPNSRTRTGHLAPSPRSNHTTQRATLGQQVFNSDGQDEAVEYPGRYEQVEGERKVVSNCLKPQNI